MVKSMGISIEFDLFQKYWMEAIEDIEQGKLK